MGGFTWKEVGEDRQKSGCSFSVAPPGHWAPARPGGAAPFRDDTRHPRCDTEHLWVDSHDACEHSNVSPTEHVDSGKSDQSGSLTTCTLSACIHVAWQRTAPDCCRNRSSGSAPAQPAAVLLCQSRWCAAFDCLCTLLTQAACGGRSAPGGFCRDRWRTWSCRCGGGRAVLGERFASRLKRNFNRALPQRRQTGREGVYDQGVHTIMYAWYDSHLTTTTRRSKRVGRDGRGGRGRGRTDGAGAAVGAVEVDEPRLALQAPVVGLVVPPRPCMRRPHPARPLRYVPAAPLGIALIRFSPPTHTVLISQSYKRVPQRLCRRGSANSGCTALSWRRESGEGGRWGL